MSARVDVDVEERPHLMERQSHYPPELLQACGDMAYRDDLTGLLNRRLLNSLFESWWRTVTEGCGHISLIMIDLDGFKEVNDRCGHLAGDAVLGATADLLRRHFRSDDLLIRYGGDEFLIVLPGVSRADAGGLAERARRAMDSLREDPAVQQAGVEEPVSFSLGVASWPDDGAAGEQILAVADSRLLADKRRRRRKADALARWALAVGLGLAVLGAGLATGFWAGRDATSVPVAIEPPDAPAPPERDGDAVEFARREAELLSQIADLKTQLDELGRRPVSGDEQEQRQAESLALEETIRRLETQLQEQARLVPAAPLPTPISGPVSAQPAIPPGPGPTPPAPAETEPVETRVAPTVALPLLRQASPPRYPEMALRLRRETQVEVVVVVDETGRVVHAEVTGPPAGMGFDEAAREAALRSEFLPGTVDGEPVAMETRITVHFRLTRSR